MNEIEANRSVEKRTISVLLLLRKEVDVEAVTEREYIFANDVTER